MAELLSLMVGTKGDKASQYKGIINNLTDIESYYSEIQKLNPFVKGGNIANMANYAQGLETVQEGLLGNIEQLHELKSETKEYYSNVL
jgi:hypothetical protein